MVGRIPLFSSSSCICVCACVCACVCMCAFVSVHVCVRACVYMNCVHVQDCRFEPCTTAMHGGHVSKRAVHEVNMTHLHF